ncbi:transglutaminase domain-containing protein [bacterium]|nr:transglutaminase domain-containing protein [bacterium]
MRIVSSMLFMVWLFWGELLAQPLTTGVFTGELDRLVECAGDNIDQITEALDMLEPEKQRALIFLLKYMSESDLAQVKSELLVHHIEYSFQAYETLPWGKEIPDDIFYHYVLPMRVSQEPLEDWRGFFYDMLYDSVKGLSMTDAALKVNEICARYVRFKQTQRRDQGVFETLKSGYGRCEEMMIFYVSALRSVCIPAREAWTPYWSRCDNNHAWTEVWVDGKWYYTGACEPRPRLNDAWFSKTAEWAPVVLASAYGKIKESDEVIYKTKDQYTIINSTPTYTDPSYLLVNVEGMDSASVYVYVFNFGALRPILYRVARQDSTVRFVMGKGEFVVSAGKDDMADFAKVTLTPGDTVSLTLVPEKSPKVPEKFWLRYDEQGEK